MVFKIRTTKTASGNTAVQVVDRVYGQTRIIKHIGSARNDVELIDLKQVAREYAVGKSGMAPLFPPELDAANLAHDAWEVAGIRHLFAYEVLSHAYQQNGFGQLNDPLLKDLVVMRILEPVSKLKSIELISKYFDIRYSRNQLYKQLGQMADLKNMAAKAAISYAKSESLFDLSLILYDVTTLYFETDIQDDLRRPGFSKDHRSDLPQIVLGLVVTRDGYPVWYDLFAGNTFEGQTMIPVMLDIKRRLGLGNLTVVADAGMLSLDNISQLVKQGLSYIVGARLSGLSADLARQIATGLERIPGAYFSLETPRGRLVCDYSQVRAAKDKSDRKKQLDRAQYQINHPDKIGKRSRFVRAVTKTAWELDLNLIAKDELWDGIKGYYTNLTENPNLIITRYKDLWHVEQTFRMAKSDLLTRPVFLRKDASIKAHVLVAFMALCVARSVELASGVSLKRTRDWLWEIADVELVNRLTETKTVKRMLVRNRELIGLLSAINFTRTY